MISLWLIAIIGAIIYGLYRMHNPKGYHYVKHFNAPPSYPVIGAFLYIFKNDSISAITKTFRYLHRTLESPVCLKILGNYDIQIFKAEQMEVIFKSRTNLRKLSPLYDFLHPWLGRGLLTSEGQQWFQQRKLLTPAFHFEILKQFIPIFDEHCRHFVKYIEKKASEAPNRTIDIRQPLTLATLDIICETSMGKVLNALEDEGENTEYIRAVKEFGDQLPYRMQRPWNHNEFIYSLTEMGKKTKRDVDILHHFTETVIMERELSLKMDEKRSAVGQDKKRRVALLDLLLELQHRGEMSRKEVREQVDTFMFEGHDTTSTGLMYILFCLATQQQYQQNVFEEIDDAFSNTDDVLTADFLNELPYTERFIKECQRLFPSVGAIGRRLEENITLPDGSIIPADTNVELHFERMHRDPAHWNNPEIFDPDNFLPENVAKRHPFAFAPFSAGARNCQKFAMTEMKSIVVYVLRNFRLFCTQTSEDIEPLFDIVLRPKNPINIRFEKR